jgi:tyrosinase
MPVDPTDKGIMRTLRHRQRVQSMAAADLDALRRSFGAMYGIADDRGYAHHAGIHGLPLPIQCHHGDMLFLPWHRAYLYFFEQAMMDQVPAARLPWWDWTDQAGIPEAFNAPLVGTNPNPLYRAPITGIPDAQLRQVPIQLPRARIGGTMQYVTFRRPGAGNRLPSPATVEAALNAPNFLDFTNRLENSIHGLVHVWTGGTMGQIPLAGFDPIFWAHHTMIDRLWALWQLRHPGVLPDPGLLDQALSPFPMTVRQTLDINALGYDYTVSRNFAAPTG